MTASSGFARGAKASQAAAEAAGGSKFAKTHYFSLDDGDRCFLRPLSSTEGADGWINVKQHMGVPTVNKPSDYQGNWPKNMPSICRNDDAFKGIFHSCYNCDHASENVDSYGKPTKAKPRVWMLGVLREQVIGDGSEELGGAEMEGKVVGLTDSLREVEVRGEDGKPTGEVTQEIAIVVINQAYSTFFEPLETISMDIAGDIRDYDFLVRRKGVLKDTSYSFLPQEQTKLRPGSNGWARYDEAIKAQNLDLEQILMDRASDEYYGRFFDPSLASASDNKPATQAASKAAPAQQQAAAPSNDVDEDALKAMRSRLQGYSDQPAASAEAEKVPVGVGAGLLDD